jgi:tetratricopeptide (TPR) repeat protein
MEETEQLPSIYMNIANIYLKREKIEEAKEYLLKVIEIDPLNETAKNTLDMLSQGKIEEISEEIVELDQIEFQQDSKPADGHKPDISVEIEEEPEEVIEVSEERPEEDVKIEVVTEKPAEVSKTEAKSKEEVLEQEDEFADELAEADFFISQQLIDEAIEIYKHILEKNPNHRVAKARLKELTQKEKADATEQEEEIIEGPAKIDIPIEQILSESKKQLSKMIDANDAQAHFDLGCAYKDMGLYDEAIEEFKIAMQNEDKEIPSLHMIALINLERDRYTDAISIFKKLLNYDEITDEQRLEFLYQIGSAYLKLKDKSEALFYLNKVYKQNPNYRNIKQLIQLLQSGEKKK